MTKLCHLHYIRAIPGTDNPIIYEPDWKYLEERDEDCGKCGQGGTKGTQPHSVRPAPERFREVATGDICPFCSTPRIRLFFNEGDTGTRRYRCVKCGCTFIILKKGVIPEP